MALTGPEGGTPLLPPAVGAARIAHLARSVHDLSTLWGSAVRPQVAAILSARSAETGWHRRGATSVNGSAHLLPTREHGFLAVNLARPYDFQVLPAVLGEAVTREHAWDAVAQWLLGQEASDAETAFQELSIPAGVVGAHADREPVTVTRVGEALDSKGRAPTVVDLSAMWAGPLSTRLLAAAGAHVTKIEDVGRPDGARLGPPRFFAELNREKEEMHVDLRTRAGRGRLRRLVEGAGVVVESSRPRALRGLGIFAEDFLSSAPGRTWLSITGYGREAYDGERVAFGDDAAAAGGLVVEHEGCPVFCGDAIADPLTGLFSAAAVLASQQRGGGELIDVSMAGVCAEITRSAPGVPAQDHRTFRQGGRWMVVYGDGPAQPVLEPTMGAFT